MSEQKANSMIITGKRIEYGTPEWVRSFCCNVHGSYTDPNDLRIMCDDIHCDGKIVNKKLLCKRSVNFTKN